MPDGRCQEDTRVPFEREGYESRNPDATLDVSIFPLSDLIWNPDGGLRYCELQFGHFAYLSRPLVICIPSSGSLMIF